MNRNIVNLTRAGLAAAVIGMAAMAAAEDPIIVLPGDIAWRAAGASGMEIAILTGDPSVAGPYTFMVRVPQGTVIPPHSHPDVWRHSTILSGTLMWAFGDTFDEAAMTALPPGSFWTEPANANHYGWARDGDVVAVGTAMGPSGMVPVGDR
mgnify:FL=1